MLFMRTFIFNAHDAARLMKANLEHDHYQAASVATVQEDPKQLWQGVTVSHPCLLKLLSRQTMMHCFVHCQHVWAQSQSLANAANMVWSL